MKYRNNPFNIRAGSNWMGLIGCRNGFCEFDTLLNGVRAACVLLMRSYRKKGVFTVSSVINRFAPSTENNVTAYLDYIENYAHISPDMVLRSRLDYAKLLSAMAFYESHTSLPVYLIMDVMSTFDINLFCLTPKKV